MVGINNQSEGYGCECDIGNDISKYTIAQELNNSRMAKTRLTKKAKAAFESIRKSDDQGQEYWTARDLCKILEYSEYRSFLPVARKAWQACYNSGIDPNDHFVVTHDMVSIGSGAERQVDNIKMTRYACYLAVQNADSNKTIVAQAQTYFAIQTRRAELLLDRNAPLTEDERNRLLLRKEMSKHNTQLAGAANAAGVKSNIDYAVFQNHGYEGLYGGLNKKAIQKRKGLTDRQNILDHMGSTELAANLFRATQTEEKLRKDKVKGKDNANRVHKEIGAKVRKAIRDIGGTMPENLPIHDDIKKLERRAERIQKANGANPESNDDLLS